MNYREILKEIKKVDWSDRIRGQIALAVFSAADGQEYTEDQFIGLCKVVKTIWGDMDNPNLQIVADCVADCYFDMGWGYHGDDLAITDEDFERLSPEKEDDLIDAIVLRS